jgi:NAD+ synthase (glutamine-hydrolysing)
MMPSPYTSQMSRDDALEQINLLGVTNYSTLDIDPTFQVIKSTLAQEFSGYQEDITEENIQARIRGMLLMALSNKTSKIVLTTSNKSETAVGYATLYGDMAGGFAVLKDVLKTQVYALCNYRNSLNRVIPERVLTRAPSAELRENQKDADTLPDYTVLDALLTGYIEQNLSPDELVAQGFSKETVARVITLIRKSEYKRKQAAVGPKVSPVAFGKNWRYPITNGFLDTK